MAYGDSFTPSGAQGEIKVRGPIWVAIWSIFGFGIYGLYWLYQTAKHLRDFGNSRGRDLGQNPTMTLLAFLIGWILLFIPPIVATWRMAKRIQQAQHLAGVQPMNGWLALVLLFVFSPAFYAYEQDALNKAWGAVGGPVPDAPTYDAPPLPAAQEQPIVSSSPESPAPAPAPGPAPGTTSGDPLGGSPERPGQ